MLTNMDNDDTLNQIKTAIIGYNQWVTLNEKFQRNNVLKRFYDSELNCQTDFISTPHNDDNIQLMMRAITSMAETIEDIEYKLKTDSILKELYYDTCKEMSGSPEQDNIKTTILKTLDKISSLLDTKSIDNDSDETDTSYKIKDENSFVTQKLIDSGENVSMSIKEWSKRAQELLNKDEETGIVKLFISQPFQCMNEEDIINERKSILEHLKEINNQEYTVVNQYNQEDTLYADNPENHQLWLLGNSIKLMGSSDLIIFSEKWQSDKDCRIEHNIATTYRMNYIDLSEGWDKNTDSDLYKNSDINSDVVDYIESVNSCTDSLNQVSKSLDEFLSDTDSKIPDIDYSKYIDVAKNYSRSDLENKLLGLSTRWCSDATAIIDLHGNVSVYRIVEPCRFKKVTFNGNGTVYFADDFKEGDILFLNYMDSDSAKDMKHATKIIEMYKETMVVVTSPCHIKFKLPDVSNGIPPYIKIKSCKDDDMVKVSLTSAIRNTNEFNGSIINFSGLDY